MNDTSDNTQRPSKRYDWHTDGMWCIETGKWVDWLDYERQRFEIERLRKALHRIAYKATADGYPVDAVKAARDALDGHAPETPDVARDAERYRWLVGECGASMLQSYFSVYDVKDWRGVKPALDKAVDAGIERESPTVKAAECTCPSGRTTAHLPECPTLNGGVSGV